MPGYASHILERYMRETRGTSPTHIDAIDQYQHALLEYWMSHLQEVLYYNLPDTEKDQAELRRTIIREFLYGAAPRPHDAMERERLATIARDALNTTTRPRFT